MNRFCRTEMLIGSEAMERLKGSAVAVFGIGGVGSYAAEALARSGIGRLMLVDDDTVSQSNINRQLIALTSTVGRKKAEVMRERVLDINPQAKIDARAVRYGADTAREFDLSEYDYVVDAIDSVTSKIMLIQQAKAANVPVISCMGAGNKLNPLAFEVADISETSVCPLARVMRRELKKRGITGVKVVYSKEEALTPAYEPEDMLPGKRQTPGSIAFVPAAAGLLLASEVIKDIAKGHS